MNYRQKHQRRLPLAHRHKNTLSSTQARSFAFENPLPQPKLRNRSFRVPSPTDSEEEELSLLEQASTPCDHLSRRGDSSLLFSPKASVVPEKKPPQPTTITNPLFQFVGSGPATTDPFTFTSSPPSTPGSLDVSVPRWLESIVPRKQSTQKQEATMVVEREPAKPPPTPQRPAQPAFGNVTQPEFGKASPLQNRLHTDNVFNIPKANAARPEHHRPAPETGTAQGPPTKDHLIERAVFQQPSHLRPHLAPKNSPDVVEIPRPVNNPMWATKPPAPPQTFSSFGDPSSGNPHFGHLYGSNNVYGSSGFASVNPYQRAGNFVDLTKPQEHMIPDSVILGDSFGAADPYNYVEAGKATENIKALLEGAFEDEEDKPRTRGRKKKAEAAIAGLTDKLKDLVVKLDITPTDKAEVEEEEEEEVDDGTVEGLKVKLLPHQVDGVEWMKDKESGAKKKNGILPKGGILADDVRPRGEHNWEITDHA